MIKRGKLSIIIVSKIEDFDAAYENDPEMAEAMQSRHFRINRAVIEDYEGEILNLEPGTIVALFNSYLPAIKFAIESQKRALHSPMIPVQLVINQGNVRITRGKPSGKILQLTNLIAKRSKPGSVLITSKVKKLIDPNDGIEVDFLEIYDFEKSVEDIQLFVVTDQELVIPEPEDIKGEIKDIDTTKKVKKKSNVTHIIISIATLITASAFFAYLNVLSSDPVIDDYSLVILPFEDVGNNEESQLISEAITKDIQHNLSLLEDLYVIASYSSMQYSALEKDNKEIAKELGVAFILRGKSHKFGDKIRISADLIDVQSGKTIWKGSYNDAYPNIMVVEAEISKEIVDALRLKLSFDDMQSVVGVPTANIQAYENFIRGRHEADKGTILGNKKSIEEYSNAIRLDTAYAEAYAEIASSVVNKVRFNEAEIKDVQKLAELYLERAENFNDQLAHIYTVRGTIYNLTGNLEKAQTSLNKALELAPNDVSTRLELAEYYKNSGQLKKQLLQNKLAYQLDPLNFDTANAYVSALILNQEYDEAAKLMGNINNLLTEVDPVEMDRQTARLFLVQKKYDDALLPLIRISDLDSTNLGSLGYVYVKIGDTIKANNMIDSLKAMDGHDYQYYNIAKIYNALKLKDSVYKYLDTTNLRQKIIRDTIFHFFDNIKNERRFKSLLIPIRKNRVDQPL